MNRRTRILVVVVFVTLGVFLGDKMLFGFFLDPWDEVAAQIQDVDEKLAESRSVMARRDEAQNQWQQVRALLAKPRKPDVQNHFYSHLGALCDRVGINPDIQGGAPQKQGEFQEYVYQMRFKITWPQFVDLVRELHNSGEFLKPIRININSRYEKEDRLDLDLRVSTIKARNGNGYGATTVPPRPQLAATALKSLRENNIFSPYRAKGEERKPSTATSSKSTSSKTASSARGAKPPLVTGIVLDPEGGDHRVIVEDRNSSSTRKFDKPKFLKAGDEFLGYTIESVAIDRVVLRKDEEKTELAVGDSFPGGGNASGGGDTRAPSAGIKELDESTRNSVLERLKSRLKKKRSYDDEQ